MQNHNPVIGSIDEIANFENIDNDTQTKIQNLIVQLKSYRDTRPVAVPKQSKVGKPNEHQPVKSTNLIDYRGDELVVLHSNADVLTPDKKTELLQLIQMHKPHIVAVSEINPKSRSFEEQDYEIPNFRMYPCNVGIPGWRGVATYVHSSIAASVSEVEVDRSVKENVWISLKLRTGDNLLFGNVYRSPNSTEENSSLINTTIRNLCEDRTKYTHQCIVGDMNLPDINWRQPHLTQPSCPERCRG